MIERLSSRHVVLLGIGHTNAHVLRMWKMEAPPDTDLTCLSDNTIATYSGMLPAVLAGQNDPQQMQIDLVQLCSSVGARLITNRVTGIDHRSKKVTLQDRPPVPFDVLSIGIGSTASVAQVAVESESLVLIKPMQTFLKRLRAALANVRQRSESDTLSLVVVGSGVAGIEITSCIPAFVASEVGRPLDLHLVTRSDVILPEVEPRTRALVAGEFDRRGVNVVTGRAVTRVTRDSVVLDDGSSFDADVVVWATGATPPALLSQLGLDLDERGFIATDRTLQSTSAPGVFAVGDTGTIINESLPKAGVYAVRQGPVLWDNLRRTLDGLPLEQYHPQRSFLKLINLGDGRAIGQWKKFAFQGRWVMRLKDSIDSGFMDKFRVVPMSGGDSDSMGDAPMQCRGCGCKVGADVLETALEAGGAIALEDAAVIGDDDSRLVASTDFFSAPVDDAFLAGQIAALHSASDIVATGALARQALANVVLPDGDRKAQQQALQDFLAGARREFDAMGATIVGGHTITGPRMEIGFTVIGQAIGESLIRKANLRENDHLYVTKPLGIGVLLAAQMRSVCPAAAFESLVDAMLQRQHTLAQIAVEVGIDAGTDVTGFGLAGHLIEMLTESQCTAEIQLDAVPILPGAATLVTAGIQSSLAPDNRNAESSIATTDRIRERAEYAMLFDPQTCGGLLFGVADEQQETFLEKVASAGLPKPVWIGRVTGTRNDKPLTVR